MKKFASVLILITALLMTHGKAETPKAPEIGMVKWGRDPDAAFAASKQSGKPIFLLFQEVPG